jgi:hypothetical protein
MRSDHALRKLRQLLNLEFILEGWKFWKKRFSDNKRLTRMARR